MSLAGFRALRHRNYRLFFITFLVSMVGTWMQSLAQSWLITELTSSRLLLGLISTLQFLPLLLFVLIGGALADRLPKRQTLVWTQTTQMLLALILSVLVFTHRVQYWHVAVLAFGLGTSNALDQPVRQAYTVELVGGKEDISSAIALNSAMFNSARILGPALAGLLIARFGVALAFLLNGISFIPIIGALFLITAHGLPVQREHTPIVHDIAEGVRYVLRQRTIFFIMSLLLAIGLFVINFQVLIPAMARDVLHTGAQSFGYLMSAFGGGALIGALLLAIGGGKKPKLVSLVTAGLVLCSITTATFFARAFPIAMAALLITGTAQVMYSAFTNTLLQMTAPNELRGRVLSIYQLLFAGTTPVGAPMTGAVIDRFGGSGAFLFDGGLGLLCSLALAVWWWITRGRDRQNAPAR